MSTLNVDIIKDTNGNNLQYLCKAWVKFSAVGTVIINDDYNVTSITDNSTGNYTVNFETPFSDTNYCPSVSVMDLGSHTASQPFVSNAGLTTGSANVKCINYNGQSMIDPTEYYASFF